MHFCRTACPVIALSLMLLLLSPRAIAYYESLDFSPPQPIAGQPVLAVLSGKLTCTSITPPVITRIGNQINLTSTFPPSPLELPTTVCLAVLEPYTKTANLGLLPVGTYVVTWNVVNSSNNPVISQTRTLIVTNPSPIPASSTASLALAAASILAIGMAFLRAARRKRA